MKRTCAPLVSFLTRWQPAWLGSYVGQSGWWMAALAMLS